MWGMSQQEKQRAEAEKINQRVNFIMQQVSDADKLAAKGQTENAKRLYIGCAEAMNKL